MRKTLIIVSLGILAGALLGVSLYRATSSKADKPEKQEVLTPAPAEKPAKPAPYKAEVDAEEEREMLQSRIQKLEAQLADQQAAGEAQADEASGPMAGLAKMLDDPEMKEVLRAQQRNAMDMTYGSLLTALNLDPDRTAALKEILLDKQMSTMEFGLKMMGTSLSKEDRLAMGEQIKEIQEGFEKQIKDALGEEDFKLFQQYEETQPERMAVTMYKQTLSSDTNLSVEQENDLILAMNEERKGFTFSSNLNDKENFDFDPASLTDEVVSTHMEELAKLQVKYVARAQDILSENQMEKFIGSMEQQHAMHEMGMTMARKMFPGNTEAPAPAVAPVNNP